MSREHCEIFKNGVDEDGNFCRMAPTCGCGDKRERSKLSTQDARLLEKMATRLRVVGWEIEARGGDGKAELDEVRELAPQVLKAMVNYI